jgi:hypothetical protein
MYSGEEFQFEVRYAQILSAFFITMMFSAGIPSLYIVLIIQMVVLFWLDKRNCKSIIFFIEIFSPHTYEKTS